MSKTKTDDDKFIQEAPAPAETQPVANDDKPVRRRRGRPKAAVRKISTTIRLDPDVIEAFRRDGPGWQSRINKALREYKGLDG